MEVYNLEGLPDSLINLVSNMIPMEDGCVNIFEEGALEGIATSITKRSDKWKWCINDEAILTWEDLLFNEGDVVVYEGSGEGFMGFYKKKESGTKDSMIVIFDGRSNI